MDAKLKADWIAALRSDEYVQERGALEVGDGNCCLGVLCKIAGFRITSANSIDGKLAKDTYDYLASVVGISDCHSITDRNDGTALQRKHSFAEMADYIEANIPADDHSVTE